jgi:hypothetical protein
MEIPVFVSCPTSLNPQQDTARSIVMRQLKKYKLEPRSLGRSDYPTQLPLREVIGIAKHCAGGIILGFEQFRSLDGIYKPGGAAEERRPSATSFPTPWNHLEAGILFGLGLPVLIFRDAGISGGIFDTGVSGAFIHPIPVPGANESLNEVFLKWQATVRRQYYGD